MSLKTKLTKLENRHSKLVFIVLDGEESQEQALLRWCCEHQQHRPEQAFFIVTGVPRVEP